MTTDTPTREELLDAMARLVLVKGQRKALEDEQRDLEALLRAALEERHNDPIVDGERGIVASLVERNKPAEIDLISFAEKPEHEALLARAARMGLLKAQLTSLRSQKGKVDCADALLAYEMPGGVSYVLDVKETR